MKLSNLVRWFWIILCQWLTSLCISLIAVFSLWNCVDYWRSANWLHLDGRIISLKISNYGENETSRPWSGHGELSCQYAYSFEGRPYSGTRIGVETFDGEGRRARRYRQLKAQMDQRNPIVVLVNPAVPTESALFRETSSEMYFGPGIGLFWFGMLFWDRKRRLSRLKNPK